MIYDDIKRDIANARKSGDKTLLNTLRFILGEVQRDPDKDYKDDNLIKLLSSIVKRGDKARKQGIAMPDQSRIDRLCRQYLPDQATEQDIESFLGTIDFSKLKNPKIALGMAKKHFTSQHKTVDMSIVQSILNKKD
jgi:uncharacterized protein YqeY